VIAAASPSTACYRPRPEHEAAARLITIAAGMAPFLGESGEARLDAEAVAALIAGGLRTVDY
jgi:hypothetical protein